MPRYIDADILTAEFKRSAVGEISFIQKVFNGICKAIDSCPVADVVPRAEVERLEQILNSYALQYGTVKDQQEVIDKIKRETAREIFAEIRKIVTAIYNKHIFGSDLEDEEKEAVMDFEVDISSAFDELEEEYGITDNAPKE